MDDFTIGCVRINVYPDHWNDKEVKKAGVNQATPAFVFPFCIPQSAPGARLDLTPCGFADFDKIVKNFKGSEFLHISH